MITRRELIKLGVMAGASMALPIRWLSRPRSVQAYSQTGLLQKFVQELRGVGGTGIPVAQPDAADPGWWQKGVAHYTIDINQFEDQLHPDLQNPTRLWGFGQNNNFKHLGGVIAVKRGTPVQITFRNNLPPDHIIPVDDTIMGVHGNQNNRVSIHLHGGHVPWISDGSPHAWWDPDGHRGPSFVNPLNPQLGINEAEYYYPNNQSARFMWYHDHAFGNTRINAYAGIASGYVIYDDYELELVATNHLPGPLDPRTVYMVFQDKVFVPSDIAAQDPTWGTVLPASRPGDLWYAHEYDPTRWDLNPGGLPLPDPSVIAEFFGDTILVNGTVYPYLEVEQREYRFRLLNACNSRFLNPRLVYTSGAGFPANTEPRMPLDPGPAFIQIGSEGGFSPYPALVNSPGQPTLILAPAERADLIVDFRNIPAGSTLLLYSDSGSPFPMGDPIYDFDPANLNTQPGYGPNTRTLLQIRVKPRVGAADPPITLPATFTPTDPFLVTQTPGIPTSIPASVKVRYLTLNEAFDEYGRLAQVLGTDQPVNPGVFGRGYMDEPTEVIQAGSTEVWEIINLSEDTHPIHFHLANCQLLARMSFDPLAYTGGVPSTGPEIAPDDNELGWKETVRANPHEVTRVLMKFDLPAVPFTVPASPRTGGHEYVWHCHILEHEEHDMMRPLIIQDHKLYLPFMGK